MCAQRIVAVNRDDRALLLNLEQGNSQKNRGCTIQKNRRQWKGKKSNTEQNITKVTAKPSNRVSKSSIESKNANEIFNDARIVAIVTTTRITMPQTCDPLNK